MRVFGPGPTRTGVSSAQITARGDDQRPDHLVRRGDRGGGAREHGVHEPGEGLAPVSDSISSAQRCTGIACATIRYTHHACRFSP